MYLKEINTLGFKSFADRINIKLDDKITCIVGPNGSGKSNIVDAVRWVLGEQSIKSLRGEGMMSDIIFSGSKSRKPLNVASVELVFDNTDNYLKYNFSEISIKRKAYRNGENEYFINKEKCRLKDIINMFMDTGMGKIAFNIISQGEVEKILSSASVERRLIIEEAAGITKYKKRKEEAIKRLEKTHENLDRVNDIINELERQVIPLREQSKKAKIYLENKEQLERIEVALLSFDIKNLSEEKNILEEKKNKIEDKLLSINNDSLKEDALIISSNQKLEELQQKTSNENNILLKIVEEVEKLNSERLLLQEKSKNAKNKNEKEEEYKNLLNNKTKLKAEIRKIEIDYLDLEKKLQTREECIEELNIKKNSFNERKNAFLKEQAHLDQELIKLKYQKDTIKAELENMSFIPSAVKEVLNENTLSGIYNTIGNVVMCDENFAKALNTAIAGCKNFIITENEYASKVAISYLKKTGHGRATFFPLDVIKERYIDEVTLSNIKDKEEYIAVLSDIVKCEEKYKNVIKNQLGQVLVSKDIDTATKLSKEINRRYKIVTLDGDIVNVGGSLTGGSENTKSRSAISIRQELHFIEEKEQEKKQEKEEINIQIAKVEDILKKIEEEYFNISLESNNLKNSLDTKKRQKQDLEKEEYQLETELNLVKELVSDNVDIKEQELLEKYLEQVNLKEKTQKNIENLNSEMIILKDKIENLSATYKMKNSEERNLEKEKNNISIRLSRIDTLMDSYLLTLNEEYSITYEKAIKEYKLEIEVEEARKKVALYKNNIKQIGMVNTDAIEEYERVNERYSFLCREKDDLLIAENSLKDIMNEMDGVIEEEFTRTYNAINEEFGKVFSELFKGGNASLVLTNESDMLTTGIDIIACPPGKKLSSISLLSGGEKTLTAISLLFAILNIRKVPFCLFDEVEAALDEANVETFGKYLSNYRNKTQFLIITHKKKTMEYADTLYGITMQESGVSKLVSVKLKEHVDTL